ncbi:hypothetical protein KIL84_010398 [Mauremys mutica]|uniref:Uncharacterized protein n=1 Tax=Mauremys mutica TaxID=74926 RepID=A0A9D3XBR6_9SAUR|nr:hypothetical protein KIL84_010398 [Mauremys mutica]
MFILTSLVARSIVPQMCLSLGGALVFSSTSASGHKFGQTIGTKGYIRSDTQAIMMRCVLWREKAYVTHIVPILYSQNRKQSNSFPNKDLKPPECFTPKHVRKLHDMFLFLEDTCLLNCWKVLSIS